MMEFTQHGQNPEVGHFYIFEAAHQHCVMPFKTKSKRKDKKINVF